MSDKPESQSVRRPSAGPCALPGMAVRFPRVSGKKTKALFAALPFTVLALAWQVVLAAEPAPSAAPAGFVLVPGGEFRMGDALGDGNSEELPVHAVTVSGFFLQQKEVSKVQWDEVREWGQLHGYTDLVARRGKAADHPVQRITWHGAVKWCNARSEKEGLIPCYYTDAAQTAVYRTGNTDLDNTMVKWRATGYRLPTEAEWERAARGGLDGKRFPLSLIHI